MAYPTNSIGVYNFADLVGPIERRQEQIEIFNRFGVDGSGLRKTGARGEPFTLKGVAFVADFTAAKALFDLYLALPGSAAQTVIRNSINHGDYYVLKVEEVSTEQVLNPTGNVVPGSTCRLTTSWKLLG